MRHLDDEHPESVNEWGMPIAFVTGRLRSEDRRLWFELLQERHTGLGLRVLALPVRGRHLGPCPRQRKAYRRYGCPRPGG